MYLGDPREKNPMHGWIDESSSATTKWNGCCINLEGFPVKDLTTGATFNVKNVN